MKKKIVKTTKKVAKMEFVEESVDESDSNYSSDDNVPSDEDESVSDDVESVDSPVQPLPVQKRRKITQEEEEIKAKKLKVKALFQPPTVQEINLLKETENSFHSNLFRLQIEEMLGEIKMKPKHQSFIENWLEKLNAFLEKIHSEDQGTTYENFDWLAAKKIEFPLKLKDFTEQSIHFKFYKPSSAFQIGSCNLGTAVGPRFTADICIEMPSKTIQKDNHFNMTYFKKRAVYLCYLASELKKFKEIDEIKFGAKHGDPFKPVLNIKPVGNKKFLIKLIVVCQSESFKLNRFVPWNSNVRSTYFKGHSGSSPISPTPVYNASVLNDLTLVRNEMFVNSKLGSYPNVKDGIMLVKIWMKQRQLDQGVYGFNMKLLTMFAIYLMREQRLHASMSCYQVARLIWHNLAQSAWYEPNNGISMCQRPDSANHPTMEQFHEHYDIVFVDSTGFFNMAANLSKSVYLRVRYESARAIELLGSPTSDNFRDLFLIKTPFYQHCDHIIVIDEYKDLMHMIKQQVSTSEFYDNCGNVYPMALKAVTNVLQKGLDDRINWMSPMPFEDTEWNTNDKPKHKKAKLIIGLVLNPETAFDVLTKGPQANLPEADEFRQFWGAKSELRRFQDSSITEACVWLPADSTLNQKRVVCKEIVMHLIDNNLQLDAANVKYVANSLDEVFSAVGPSNWFDDRFTDTENLSLPVIRAFDGVGKSLREMKDLPLGVTSVQGISSVFRYCDPFPYPKFVNTLKQDGRKVFLVHKFAEGVIQLEISGKWPDDLAAIRRIKAAFLLQIAKNLENETDVRCNSDSIDIVKDGYLFRIYIAIPKEVGLLKKEFSGSGIIQYRDTEESVEMEKMLMIMPKLTSSLHAIYQRHYSFGPTVMISKNWLYSQMIDSYLWPDECTELLIAHQFHKATSGDKPNQPQAGFFRFLQLLASSDWINDLVFIDFNNEIEPVDISDIEKEFQESRDKFPPLCIMTSYDSKRVGLWSKRLPSAAVLGRVTILARHALSQIEKLIFSGLSVESIFKSSFEGYHLLIHLNLECIKPTYTALSETKYNHPSGKLEEEGFNAVQFLLRDLRQAYDDFAVFFYNPCEGSAIAVLWKPNIFQPIEFTTTTHAGRKLTKDGMAVCDIDTFIEDFQHVGRGVINRIEKLKC